jgi:hypothetical protein
MAVATSPACPLRRRVWDWHGDGPAPELDPPTATFLGGVARKP